MESGNRNLFPLILSAASTRSSRCPITVDGAEGEIVKELEGSARRQEAGMVQH